MEARQIQRNGKILMTDLSADKGKHEENLTRYQGMLAAAFSSYALIKLSMNFFTLGEMEQERREEDEEGPGEDFLAVKKGVRSVLSTHPEKDEESTREFRDRITARMKVLTAYTDFFELHEYILNRKEAGLLEEIEKIARAHAGVTGVFAVQAGRDVRVLVDPAAIGDQAAAELASEICRDISARVTFPGMIRVTVIRELRCVEYAK